MKHTITLTSLLIASIALVVVSCSTGGGSSSSAAEECSIKATELAHHTDTVSGNATDAQRYRYISLSLSSSSSSCAGDYRLALREDSKAAPLATAISAAKATQKYTIGTTAINIMLSFNMDTTLFDAGTLDTNDYPSNIHDVGNAAHKAVTAINTAMLKPGTAYTLYALKDGDEKNSVIKLGTYSTDDEADATIESFPIGYTYAHKDGEPFLLPTFQSPYGANSVFYTNTDLINDNTLPGCNKTGECLGAVKTARDVTWYMGGSTATEPGVIITPALSSIAKITYSEVSSGFDCDILFSTNL